MPKTKKNAENLKPENIKAWLQPAGRSAAELQQLLDDKQRAHHEHQVPAA